jgi:hypothetical protein
VPPFRFRTHCLPVAGKKPHEVITSRNYDYLLGRKDNFAADRDADMASLPCRARGWVRQGSLGF